MFRTPLVIKNHKRNVKFNYLLGSCASKFATVSYFYLFLSLNIKKIPFFLAIGMNNPNKFVLFFFTLNNCTLIDMVFSASRAFPHYLDNLDFPKMS